MAFRGEGKTNISILAFAEVKTNLHIVLVMDFTRPTFTIACQSNPGFFKECAVQWMEGWSERSMLRVRDNDGFSPEQLTIA